MGNPNDVLVDELDEEEKKLFEGEITDDIVVPDLDEETGLPKEDKEEDTKETKPEESAEEPEVKAEGEEDIGVDLDEIEVDSEGRLRDKQGRFVPQGALHAEREKRKGIQNQLAERDRQIAEMREKWSRADERLQLLYRAAQQEEAGPVQTDGEGAQQVQEKPDKYQNPFEYMDWLEQQLNGVVTQSRQSAEEAQREAEYETAYNQARDWFVEDAKQAINWTDENGNQPYQDFAYAYAHVINARDRELQTMGYSNAKARAEIIKQEEFAIVQAAAQQQKSPSLLIYNLAKERGYAGPPAEENTEKSSAESAENREPSAVDQVRKINEAQKKNKSLGGASGAQGKPQWSAEYLAEMSEEEFDKVLEKMTPSQMRQYFGG